MYVLNIDNETNRILSAAIMPKTPIGAVPVYTLPDGDITDYLYVDGAYVYDPIPTPEEPTEPQPTPEERIAALEEKLAAYEAKFAAMESEAV